MKGYITTCGGKIYELPTLTAWKFSYTGGVPCDSFVLTCPFEPSMAGTLRMANRFTARDDGRVEFCGVIDETRISCDESGLTLELSGRGMAALLLDNEADAAVYQCATTGELLREHAAPCGIACTAWDEVRAGTLYRVKSGTSRWKALADFTRLYGGFTPYMAKDGTLTLKKARGQKTVTIDETTPVTEIAYADRRYGVISETEIIDKTSGARQIVRNADFLDRGGQCRHVYYMPSHADAHSMRYTGEYQIERSKENAETLRVAVARRFDAEAGGSVRVTHSKLGVTGNFTIKELTRTLSERGEKTELIMQRE